MRTILISVLVILARSGPPAYAQMQRATRPTSPAAAANGNAAHPLAQRLYFYMSDPMGIKRPARAHAAQPSSARGFVRPNDITRTSGFSTLRFPATGLRPLPNQPSQDPWRLLKPKNTRLFFFSKP